MASPELLDFDAILAPIPGEAPGGVNMREDPSPTALYRRIKDARTKARTAERKQLESDDPSAERPDWSPLLTLVPEALATQAKDLEVTVWLIEALARLGGFAGMRDGFRLARELCERYWDGLHPMPDEDGIATRVAPLAGLNGTLPQPCRQVAITGEGEFGAFATWQFIRVSEAARLDDERRAKREAENGITADDFQRAVEAGSPTFYRDLLDDIQAAYDELGKLSATLDELSGPESPSTSTLRDAIEEVGNAVKFISKDRLPVEDEPAAEDGGASESGGDAAPAAPATRPGVINSREDALAALRKVSVYFRKAEPHSPISYVLERAVRWGEMPLPQLLQELIPDDGARSSFHNLTGVRVPEE